MARVGIVCQPTKDGPPLVASVERTCLVCGTPVWVSVATSMPHVIAGALIMCVRCHMELGLPADVLPESLREALDSLRSKGS